MPRHNPKPLLVLSGSLVLLGAAGLATPALSASDHRTGQGSEASNPDLMAGAYVPGYAEPTVLRESYNPFFDINWSVGAFGASQTDNDGQHYEVLLSPEVSFTHQGSRANLSLEAGADLSKADENDARLTALRFAFGTDYLLDQVTKMSAAGSLELTQASVLDTSVDDEIAVAPQVIDAALEASIERRFGKLSATLTGTVGRTTYGESTATDGTETDNTGQSVTTYGTGLRLGYELTPILTAFVDGSAESDAYDAASASLGVKLDGTTYELRTGLSANWDGIWQVEGSVGVGLRQYQDTTIAEVSSTLYDLGFTFSPNETLEFTGALATEITPPTEDGETDTAVDYTASAGVNYTMNSWLALRASAAWNHKTTVTTGVSDSGYGFGLGADYLLNRHATLSADYSFAHTDASTGGTTETATEAEDVHRFVLGVTISR